MTNRMIFLLLGSLSLLSVHCKQPSSKPNNPMSEVNFSLPMWAKNATIYEVNIRQYTPEGTFLAFKKHLPRLQKMGVSILWFMPIYPISHSKKKGSLGSYYAVSDFKKTNPNFGSLEDFKSVIEEAHSLGMKVILDWVPNHTGWDHVWMKTNPDFYTKNDQGEIMDPLNEHGESMGWTDVADLNYNNTALWDSMKNDMLFWVENYKIDGFRQDMAMLVPLEFWEKTSKELLQVNPDLFLLAESEEKDHVNKNCFHLMYAWSLHHILNDIAKGKSNANAIDHWRNTEFPKATKGLFMQFITNHDENSWSGSEVERMGEAYKTMAVLTYTLDGIPLMYSGQEEPLTKRLLFFEKDTIPFSIYANENFYTQLNHLKRDHPAMWNGPYGGDLKRILKNEHIYAFSRTKDQQTIVVILNLSDQPQTVVSDISFSGKNLFTGYETTLKEGQEFSLSPWQYFVLIPKK